MKSVNVNATFRAEIVVTLVFPDDGGSAVRTAPIDPHGGPFGVNDTASCTSGYSGM
jgi:hypothetical protein